MDADKKIEKLEGDIEFLMGQVSSLEAVVNDLLHLAVNSAAVNSKGTPLFNMRGNWNEVDLQVAKAYRRLKYISKYPRHAIAHVDWME